MTPQQIETYRDRLRAELIALDRGDTIGRDGRRTVELDQQSVGRLSRMDALQQQAMAEAQQARRAARRRRIELALQRIEDDDFGWCADCGEAIAPGRLDLDPTVPTCVSCARG